MRSPAVSLILACYNEGAIIEDRISRIFEVLDAQPASCEVIFVDDPHATLCGGTSGPGLHSKFWMDWLLSTPTIGAILKNPNGLPFVGRQVQSLASFRLSNEQFSPIETGFFRKQCWVAP